jgi:hypothetical protein
MSRPYFWSQPLRYLRWSSHEYPAIFYSFIVGAIGPMMLVTAPPLRRYFGDDFPSRVPRTYPSKLEWEWEACWEASVY